jgi:hypothetical protein
MTSYVDYYNYTYPIQYITKGPYSKLDLLLNKLTYIYFSQIKTETDNGWIFTSNSIIYSTEVDYTETDINKVKIDGIIASVYVCASPSLELFYRRYKKIQEIAGSIGGIFTAFYIICSSIVKYFFTFIYDVTFANSVFYFSFKSPFKSSFIFHKVYQNDLDKLILDSVKLGKNISENSKSNIKIPSQVSEFKLDFIPTKNKKLGRIKSKQIFEMSLSLKNLFRLVFDYITSKGKTLKKEYRIIKKQIMIYADLINIAKNIVDVEKMKKILLNHFPHENSLGENKKILYLNNVDIVSDMKGIIFSKFSINKDLENKDNV